MLFALWSWDRNRQILVGTVFLHMHMCEREDGASHGMDWEWGPHGEEPFNTYLAVCRPLWFLGMFSTEAVQVAVLADKWERDCSSVLYVFL